ncbi:MAG TPA: Ldh family oxidoreductase [Alphaproteobacteria bacterium]|jgi:LDH2 family malate/lactate/ureidoglycolate dehydrogenase|nr:Ldh family oxidoreductase [Alphaproteobacteria bacterium]MDP7429339.1 Ldh family oxidoreductase [Alphaproteobacteria bacterium]HJM51339.1 Ldh family oxidoreductase [Alphaproteobacteria bacterium]
MADRDEATVSLPEPALTGFCRQVFSHLGLPQDDAAVVADSLVDADLSGIASHGLVRLPIYVERLRAGVVAARPEMRIEREGPATAVLDGGNGMGQVVSRRAMEIAIEKGREQPAFVSVGGSNHNGALGYWAAQAVAHDCIGIAFTIGGINHMAPWGGAEAMLGNNPFAIALPAGEEAPVVLDMACSVAARGKVNVAADRGEAIPEGWCLGPDGLPTTDPLTALQGFVLPLAGHKGYAMTVAFGLLSSMLSGAAFGSEVTHLYDDLDNPQNVGHLFGVLPVAAFEDLAVYRRRMQKAIKEIRGLRRAPGVERIYLPGERERLLRAERRQSGVPLARGTVAGLRRVADELGVDPL